MDLFDVVNLAALLFLIDAGGSESVVRLSAGNVVGIVGLQLTLIGVVLAAATAIWKVARKTTDKLTSALNALELKITEVDTEFRSEFRILARNYRDAVTRLDRVRENLEERHIQSTRLEERVAVIDKRVERIEELQRRVDTKIDAQG